MKNLAMARIPDVRSKFAKMALAFGRWIILFFGLILTAACSPILPNDISGVYVGWGDNGAFLLQLVQTGDGHLTGRYQQVTLDASGKLTDFNASITGASNGQTVVITIDPNVLLAPTFTVSGPYDGKVLRLAGGGDNSKFALNLINGDEGVFRNRVAGLTKRADDTKHRAIEADAVANIAKALTKFPEFTQQLDAFNAHADLLLQQFGPTEDNYRNTTAKMAAALAKEQSIFGEARSIGDRSPISVWINQVAIAALNVHQDVQTAYQDFRSHADAIALKSSKAKEWCSIVTSDAQGGPQRVDYAAWKSVCAKLLRSAKTFDVRVKSLQDAFAHVEKVWLKEGARQDVIVKASDEAAR